MPDLREQWGKRSFMQRYLGFMGLSLAGFTVLFASGVVGGVAYVALYLGYFAVAGALSYRGFMKDVARRESQKPKAKIPARPQKTTAVETSSPDVDSTQRGKTRQVRSVNTAPKPVVPRPQRESRTLDL